MGLQHFYGPLLCAGSRAAREKIAVSGIGNRLNHILICIMYKQFTNVAAGSITQAGGPWVGDPWCTVFVEDRKSRVRYRVKHFYAVIQPENHYRLRKGPTLDLLRQVHIFTPLFYVLLPWTFNLILYSRLRKDFANGLLLLISWSKFCTSCC